MENRRRERKVGKSKEKPGRREEAQRAGSKRIRKERTGQERASGVLSR